jgi:hypothetical protein
LYPERYQLPQLTAHLIAALERRRAAVTDWSAEVEKTLTLEAKDVLLEAGKQFAELADDKGYWQRIEEAVNELVLPRYFKLAREEQESEKKKHGVWRGGDLVSRAAYAAAGLLGALIIWKTPIPEYLEPVPLALFIVGPMIPDLQFWWAKRAFRAAIADLVEDMRAEAASRDLYRPMLEAVDPGASGASAERPAEGTKEKT